MKRLVQTQRITIGRSAALAVLFLLLALAFSLPAPAAASRLTLDALLNEDGSLKLSQSKNGALDLGGWDVLLDSRRGPVLLRAKKAQAKYPSAWSRLSGKGLAGYHGPIVHVIYAVGTDLYVGGRFDGTRDGNVKMKNIAKYDTVNKTWSALPGGGLELDGHPEGGTVYAMTQLGNTLYIGGWFKKAANEKITGFGQIAKLDLTTNKWSKLSDGLNDRVYALTTVGTDLYIGGAFTATKNNSIQTLNHIAKYDTVNETWSALAGEGLVPPTADYSAVNALVVVGTDLYVGGRFGKTADGSVSNLNNIAKYDTAADVWSTLPGNGLDRWVYALKAKGDELYVGGAFFQTADGSVTNLNSIAKFDMQSNSWSALPNQGMDYSVNAIEFVGNDVYVGGLFVKTKDDSVTNMANVAKLDTSNNIWSPLFNNGVNSQVFALAVSGSTLFVGGQFDATRDEMILNLNGIAAYDTTQTCATQLPARPILLLPWNGQQVRKTQVWLRWASVMCAERYRVIVNEDSPQGPRAFAQGDLTETNTMATGLEQDKTYFWKVVSINDIGKAKSDWWEFTIK